MSHAEKYFCIHKAQAADVGDTTFRIEILEDGFGGSATEVNGLGEVFRLHYEKTDTRNPLESPIQKGRMEFIMAVEDSNDLAIVNEFVGADETQYQMRLKKDGSVIWTGYILGDLLRYSEDDYPFPAQIVAKDLSRLSATDYPLEDERETIITTIADILSNVGLGIDIHTYTSWITSDTTDSDDFLNQIYNETFALRSYGDNEDEGDEQITNESALENILRNYGLILRQVENTWRLYQLSALSDPTSVKQFVYDSSGVQQTNTDVNIQSDIDRSNRYVFPESVSNLTPAVKRAEVVFNHRSSADKLLIPNNVYITGVGTESFTQSFISTGNEEISLQCRVRAYHSTLEISGYADVKIRVGQYYWNGSTWTTTTTDRKRVDLPSVGGVQRDDGQYIYQGILSVSTNTVPGDATSPIEIEFENVVIEASPDVVADETAYENISFNVKKVQDDEANSESIKYTLSQSGDYSVIVDIGSTLFGDGPAVSSRSALRYSTATSDITSTSWQRRGTTTGYRLLHENLLKEIIDLQRSNTRNIQAVIYGNYSPANLISYESDNFFFLGGELNANNRWRGDFFRINIAEASDTLSTILDYDSSSSSITVSSASNSVTLQNRDFVKNQRITTTSSTISGTVTSVPIVAVGETFLNVGDVFYVFNIVTAELIEFTLGAPQLPNDSSLTVQSKALSSSIPQGSWIIFTGERISSYINRSDTAIRLGVRSYEQATTEDGEAYQTEDGDDWHFATEEDQTALNHHTSSEIALLQGQIVLKATAGGRLALVDLNANPETGSEIDIVADQIDINNISFIKATGTIKTDNFVEGSAGWRIRGNGDAEFNNVTVRNSLVTETEVQNLTVKTGDITISEDGRITNENEDFIISVTGVVLDVPDDNITNPTSFSWDRNDSIVASIGTFYSTTLSQSRTRYYSDRHYFEVTDEVAFEAYYNSADDYSVVDIKNLLRLPAHTDSTRDALSNVTQGMVIWNQDDGRIQVYDGTGWARIATV